MWKQVQESNLRLRNILQRWTQEKYLHWDSSSKNGYCLPKTVYQVFVLCNIPSSSSHGLGWGLILMVKEREDPLQPHLGPSFLSFWPFLFLHHLLLKNTKYYYDCLNNDIIDPIAASIQQVKSSFTENMERKNHSFKITYLPIHPRLNGVLNEGASWWQFYFGWGTVLCKSDICIHPLLHPFLSGGFELPRTVKNDGWRAASPSSFLAAPCSLPDYHGLPSQHQHIPWCISTWYLWK